MIFKDYYKILGLETNRVNPAELKAAYREQAKKYHPDVNGTNKQAEERFKDINEAYRVLSDISSKRKYDRMWNRNIGKNKNSSYEESRRQKDSLFSDFFNMFFGNMGDMTQNSTGRSVEESSKGENIETQISISIEEAFRGKEKEIGIKTVEGRVKKFQVKIPAGIQNNEKIRIVGQGKPGKAGGKNGDLFIRIKIDDDEQFKLEGCNLRKNLYLTPWEAALSTKVTINGINEEVSVYIPSGIQSGEIIKIENKGYKDGKGGRGDLILETKIMIPKKLSENEKKLFTKLNEISKFNPRSTIKLT